jgi:3-keto-L-gulonate-6-phosphate decarboxylase
LLSVREPSPNFPQLQLALDVTRVEHAVAIAQQVHGLFDRLEVGTPLIRSEGHRRSIGVLRSYFPDTPLIADAKIMDRGRQETEACLRAGADGVIVQAVAPAETIHAVYETAAENDAETLVDGLGTNSVRELVERAQALPVDWLVVHRGKDEQALDLALPLLDVRNAADRGTSLPLALAGGISANNVADCAREPLIGLLIVGEAVVQSPAPRDAATQILRISNETRIPA